MRWSAFVARMRPENAEFCLETGGKETTLSPRCRWEDNIKSNPKERRY